MAGQILVVLKDPILRRELFDIQTHVKSNLIFANEISDLENLSSFPQIDLLITEFSYFQELNEAGLTEFFELNCPSIMLSNLDGRFNVMTMNKTRAFNTRQDLSRELIGSVKTVLQTAGEISSTQIKSPQKFVTNDAKMLQILKEAKQVAGVNSNILILGESGTGKDILANFIHQQSNRRKEPFIKINCAAIPQSLLETELFGSKKGAFTGAFEDKIGKIQLADRGTLFLDEIGDLHPALQGKLLRVLESGEVDVVGGVEPVKVDVRLISATNQDLWQSIRQKKFRKDLFYRLNVIAFHLRPLRERPEDIIALFDLFSKEYSKIYNVILGEIDQKYLQDLFEYDWPGNVREFKSFVDQLVRKCQTQKMDPLLISSELKRHSRQEIKAATSLDEHLLVQEKLYILKLLTKNKFRIVKTAEELEIDRVSLYRKIKKFNINVKELKKKV